MASGRAFLWPALPQDRSSARLLRTARRDQDPMEAAVSAQLARAACEAAERKGIELRQGAANAASLPTLQESERRARRAARAAADAAAGRALRASPSWPPPGGPAWCDSTEIERSKRERKERKGFRTKPPI